MENSIFVKVVAGIEILSALFIILGTIWMFYKYFEKLAKIANGE
ncbi:hypothetical protein SAMN02745746_04060 [Pseudogulbenkiania subflava DSM 22618]|uniref:Uncharacterized protein n=2 Tax=Pseudogulbenkiania subflava TaxID=451637 RepID=A0A1Y6CED7_9NEIS|nr:hypothetical protein SAMN02745746_04060 [Pseudogulbenkiania subflava DSM 22618]